MKLKQWITRISKAFYTRLVSKRYFIRTKFVFTKYYDLSHYNKNDIERIKKNLPEMFSGDGTVSIWINSPCRFYKGDQFGFSYFGDFGNKMAMAGCDVPEIDETVQFEKDNNGIYQECWFCII